MKEGTSQASYFVTADPSTPMGKVDEIVLPSVKKLAETPRQLVAIYNSISGDFSPLVPAPDFKEIIKSHLAFALQKDSELKEAFDYYIVNMDQNGVLHQIVQDWLKTRKSADMTKRIFSTEATPVAFNHTFFLALLLAGGTVSSILVFLAERFFHRGKRPKNPEQSYRFIYSGK